MNVINVEFNECGYTWVALNAGVIGEMDECNGC